MIRTLDLRGRKLSKAEINREIPRARLDVETAMVAIAPILERVKTGSVETLRELAQEFDGVKPAQIRVPPAALDQALAELDPAIRTALELSISRVRKVHEDQVRSVKTVQVVDGGTVTEKWIPVDRVGLYVPGGRAVYPSSVMMNVVPAQIAKVSSIAVASPPQKEFGGLPHPTILATCALLGITEVYAVGGAQAIALFAYGIEGFCEKCDLVTGPGNIYVAAAKRALRGVIGIDSEAGPTEIAILADESAFASDVAADLISQSEHDPIAAAVLVTTSSELAIAVQGELKNRVAATKHCERITTALSGIQSAIVLVDSIAQGLDVVNAYAAEHLEIQTKNAASDAEKIRNAGAVFIGRFTPVSLGDYAAGSNHVLPTGGCACHSSGLSVQTFLRGLHFVSYNQESFLDLVPTVVTLANSEDLPAHGEAYDCSTGTTMTNSNNWPSWLPLREPLKPMSPYGAPQVPASAQLNTNENPFAPSTALVAAITKRVAEVSATLNRYPDRDAIALRAGLAKYITAQTGVALDVANLWAANGSNEIIQSIFLAFGRESALGFTPSYSMHPLIAKVTSVHWQDGKRRDDHSLDVTVAAQQVVTAKPTLTFITTPNNPTGSVVKISEIIELAKATAAVGGLLVVDEAYAEFSNETSAVTLISQYPNVIVIRTMSKAFAFAGARLGYLIADPAVIDALQLVRLPYHLSAITQAVAEVALSFAPELLAGVDTLISQREIVQAGLIKLGLSITPSAANFLLFSGFTQPADQIWQKLLDRGILIRDVGLLGQLRVTIGTAAENQAFLSALTEVLAEGDK